MGLKGWWRNACDSKYEPGRGSGAWRKMRVDKTHSFVIGGYRIGGSTFDALVFGYYDQGKLLFCIAHS
jgi:ATP-dependent DNA ligase